MKNTVLAFVLLASTSSFAFVAPKGEYLYLSCVSADKKNNFNVQLMKDTRDKNVNKMILTAHGGILQTYTAKEHYSDRAGAPVVYDAPAAGGRVGLSVNFTTSPNPKGRPAQFVSAVYGKATRTPMWCNVVAY
jgi:hypothetical protein